jgi:hypothetical protein
MRSFRIGAFLVLIILVGAVAAVAYNLGVSAGLSDAAVAAGATVVTAPAAISPLGIIVGGFFLLLFVGFLAKVIAGPRHYGAYGGWGRGYYRHWDGENVPEQFRPMLERWHSEAHTSAGGPPPSGGPTSGGPGMPPPPAWRPSNAPPPANQPPTGA